LAKRFFLTTLVIAVFLVVASVIIFETSARGKLSVDVISATNSITLNMNDLGDTFQIYHNGKMIWEGKDKSYSIKGLEPDNKYTFEVIALDGEKQVIDFVRVKADTLPDQEAISKQQSDVKKTKPENKMKSTEISAVIGQEQVILKWDKLPDDDNTYELYRNGKFLGKVKGQKYTDTDVKPNQQYTYRVVGYKEIPKKQQEEIIQAAKEKNIRFSDQEKMELSKEPFILVQLIETLGADYKKEIQESNVSIQDCTYTPGYLIRYNTFIPMKKAANPWSTVSSIEWFGGDNRGFDAWSDKYRTRTEARVRWLCNGTILYTWKKIGWTTGYDAKGNIIKMARAPSKGIKMYNQSITSNKVSFSLDHEVGNPLVASPDISYSYDATIYYSGSFSITGWHDRAPSHEIYFMTFPGDTWSTIHQSSHKGFGYLWPGTPKTNFSLNR